MVPVLIEMVLAQTTKIMVKKATSVWPLYETFWNHVKYIGKDMKGFGQNPRL